MTRTILVAGTASHVGKSTVATGLCRLLADRGASVVPFKAQTMSNNAWVVPVAGAADGRAGEIGVAQRVQARAARRRPTTDHNPVLLKPRGDGESQVVIDGEAVADVAADEYFGPLWHRARTAAIEALRRLDDRAEVIVAEGAGGIAEPNLLERDLANVETARAADADVLLLADIDRGGAFAALLGALEWLPADLRERVVGAVLTKFRGDRDILGTGIERFERRTRVPVVGVLPHDDPGLPDEDSVALPADGRRRVLGREDGIGEGRTVRIGVVRVPRLANATDLDALARTPGVRLEVLAPTSSIDHLDAAILPGTKNTVDDLRTLIEAGMGERLRAFDGPIVGICGGYQQLGERLIGAHREGSTDERRVEGLGLLPVETRFRPGKRVRWVERRVLGGGPLGEASGVAAGYEIHHGVVEPTGPHRRPFEGEGAIAGSVLGTAMHALFSNDCVREAFLDGVFDRAGIERPPGDPAVADLDAAIDRAAGQVAEGLDLGRLGFQS